MGCVLGKGSSQPGVSSEPKNPRVESGKSEVAAARVETTGNSRLEEVRESEAEKEEKVEGGQKSRESRRRSRQNPRPRNVPKQSRAEQVAAGWPPWLTDICGEALSGWVPRRANTFEKIDK
ncbi:hypothetical protein CRG98_035004, partial [Punica granatum]